MERIKVVVSKNIHILGIKAGDEITLDYYEDELHLLLDDISKNRLLIVDKELNTWVTNVELPLEDLALSLEKLDARNTSL